jgi:hypothetical protein
MRRPLGGLIGAAGLTAILSGCVRADMELTVRSDDQVDGVVVMAVDRSFAAEGDQAQATLLAALRSRAFHGNRAGAHEEPYADERYMGTKVVVDRMTLLDFDRSTGDGGIKIVHQGGRFKLSGRVDTTDLAAAAAAASAGDAGRMADTFDVSIRVTFPGRVVSSNGMVAGRTVKWRPHLGERVDLAAEAEDGGSGLPWPWLVPLGLVVVGAAGVLLALRRFGGLFGSRPIDS